MAIRNLFLNVYIKIILAIAISSEIFGQVNNTIQLSGADPLNTITTAVPFLVIAPDARGGGLADVGVATTPDANSIHWNPAKFAFIDKKMGLSISYTPWLRALVPDINLIYLSAYKNINYNQVIAMSLRYFSLGDINFSSITGTPLGSFKPTEYAVDMAYSRKLGGEISLGVALRYIHSDLTGGINLGGTQTHPGWSVAQDVSGYYHHELNIAENKSLLAAGINISNIGNKISYTKNDGTGDFIPTNLRFGTSLRTNFSSRYSIALAIDINKLLVPTPPIRDSTNQIVSGKDPNVSVLQGMYQSFSDAPGGSKEELKEYNYSLGIEQWYDNKFALRAGYFHEPTTKGNRKYYTIGIGIRYSICELDFAYLIPQEQRHPLENTIRFSLSFDIDSFKSKDKIN